MVNDTDHGACAPGLHTPAFCLASDAGRNPHN